MLTLETHIQTDNRVWEAVMSPNAQFLATAGDKLRIYQLKDGTFELLYTLTYHKRMVRCVQFSPCGQFLAAGSFDATISLWRVHAPESTPSEVDSKLELLDVLEGHESEIKSLCWRPSCSKMGLASSSRDRTVWLFERDGDAYECLTVLEGHTADVKHVLWISPDSLVTASYDNTIRLWEEMKDDFVCIKVFQGHQSTVWRTVIGGTFLYSCSADASLRRWEIPEKASLPAKLYDKVFGSQPFDVWKLESTLMDDGVHPHTRPIYDLAHWGDQLVSGGGDACLRFFDLSSLKLSASHKEAHAQDINSVHAYGPQLVTAGDDGSVKIWSREHL